MDSLRPFLIEGEQAGARYRLAAPRGAPMGTAGSQLARSAGSSMEFMEHREYQPGDDLRRMNWGAYARTDKLIVKVYRQEVCPHVDLVVDGSRSMRLAGTEKSRAAAGLTAALAAAAANSGYSRRVFLTGDGCRPIARDADRPAAWEGFDFSARQSPPESFRAGPPALRSRGIRVLLSDLLWLGDPMELLTPLAERAASVVVIQLLAAADAEPPGRGSVRLTDCETGEAQEIFLDAAGQTRYRQNLAQLQHDWQLAARRVGATFIPLVAEQICRAWDLSPLVQAEALTL